MLPEWNPRWAKKFRCRTTLLAGHNLGALDPAGRVSGIDYKLRLPHDRAVVVVGMVGHYEHAVVLAEILHRDTFHLQVVFPAFADEREIRVVIADLRARLLQQFNDGQGRGLAQIVN